MFAKSVVLADAFLDLPVRARCLYFMLGMVADDDGFVNSPKGVQRQCGASAADLKTLIDRDYLIAFDSGVVVLRHWRVHNLLKKDRYKQTDHVEEKAQLVLEETRTYGKRSEPLWNPSGTHLEPQVREGKEREGKDREGQDREGEFRPPTLVQVGAYCRQRRSPVSPRRFLEYYTANGWMQGQTKIRDWKAALRAWEERELGGGCVPVRKEEAVRQLEVPEHPEIAWALRTGYPSWAQEEEGEEDADGDVS